MPTDEIKSLSTPAPVEPAGWEERWLVAEVLRLSERLITIAEPHRELVSDPVREQLLAVVADLEETTDLYSAMRAARPARAADDWVGGWDDPDQD